MITFSTLNLRRCFINTAQHLLPPSQKHYQTPVHNVASSLLKSSKFLILQFLVKCCKLHSVFKILSKSHMLDIFLISSVYYKCSYKLYFILSKNFNSLNLCINRVNMCYPDYQNKKLNLCMLNYFKDFHLCIK